MPRKGRELELLLKRLENVEFPEGATINSPHYLEDKITGQLREVDVTVSYKLGTKQILIGFECRDRNKTEDATWIEQIKGKHDDLDTDIVIAVSSKEFTKPALIKAKHYGIRTRIIENISKKDLDYWLSPNFQINQKKLIAQITYIMIHHNVKENAKGSAQTIGPNEKRFKCNNEIYSIWEIMNFGLKKNTDYSKIPEDESEYEIAYSIDFDAMGIEAFLLMENEQPINKIDFRVKLKYQIIECEMKRVIRYSNSDSDKDKTVYEGFEHEIEIDGRKEIMSFFKDPNTSKGFVSKNYADE